MKMGMRIKVRMKMMIEMRIRMRMKMSIKVGWRKNIKINADSLDALKMGFIGNLF